MEEENPDAAVVVQKVKYIIDDISGVETTYTPLCCSPENVETSTSEPELLEPTKTNKSKVSFNFLINKSF